MVLGNGFCIGCDLSKFCNQTIKVEYSHFTKLVSKFFGKSFIIDNIGNSAGSDHICQSSIDVGEINVCNVSGATRILLIFESIRIVIRDELGSEGKDVSPLGELVHFLLSSVNSFFLNQTVGCKLALMLSLSGVVNRNVGDVVFIGLGGSPTDCIAGFLVLKICLGLSQNQIKGFQIPVKSGQLSLSSGNSCYEAIKSCPVSSGINGQCAIIKSFRSIDDVNVFFLEDGVLFAPAGDCFSAIVGKSLGVKSLSFCNRIGLIGFKDSHDSSVKSLQIAFLLSSKCFSVSNNCFCNVVVSVNRDVKSIGRLCVNNFTQNLVDLSIGNLFQFVVNKGQNISSELHIGIHAVKSNRLVGSKIKGVGKVLTNVLLNPSEESFCFCKIAVSILDFGGVGRGNFNLVFSVNVDSLPTIAVSQVGQVETIVVIFTLENVNTAETLQIVAVKFELIGLEEPSHEGISTLYKQASDVGFIIVTGDRSTSGAHDPFDLVVKHFFPNELAGVLLCGLSIGGKSVVCIRVVLHRILVNIVLNNDLCCEGIVSFLSSSKRLVVRSDQVGDRLVVSDENDVLSVGLSAFLRNVRLPSVGSLSSFLNNGLEAQLVRSFCAGVNNLDRVLSACSKSFGLGGPNVLCISGFAVCKNFLVIIGLLRSLALIEVPNLIIVSSLNRRIGVSRVHKLRANFYAQTVVSNQLKGLAGFQGLNICAGRKGSLIHPVNGGIPEEEIVSVNPNIGNVLSGCSSGFEFVSSVNNSDSSLDLSVVFGLGIEGSLSSLQIVSLNDFFVSVRAFLKIVLLNERSNILIEDEVIVVVAKVEFCILSLELSEHSSDSGIDTSIGSSLSGLQDSKTSREIFDSFLGLSICLVSVKDSLLSAGSAGSELVAQGLVVVEHQFDVGFVSQSNVADLCDEVFHFVSKGLSGFEFCDVLSSDLFCFGFVLSSNDLKESFVFGSSQRLRNLSGVQTQELGFEISLELFCNLRKVFFCNSFSCRSLLFLLTVCRLCLVVGVLIAGCEHAGQSQQKSNENKSQLFCIHFHRFLLKKLFCPVLPELRVRTDYTAKDKQVCEQNVNFL